MSSSIPTIEAIEQAANRTDLPQFRPGDTIRVHNLISEGGKERVQVFEGVCIHRKRGGGRGSFTVRKVSSSHGVGVERVWPENSPRVVKVELVTRGKVRKAKLYYLRNLRGNAARIKSKLGEYGEVLAGQSTAMAESQAEQAEDAEAEGVRHAAEEAAKQAEAAAKKKAESGGEAEAAPAEEKKSKKKED
jgi:large subunit ribosomal protein L19